MNRDALINHTTDTFIKHVKMLSAMPTFWSYGHVSGNHIFMEQCSLMDFKSMYSWLKNNHTKVEYARDYDSGSEHIPSHAIVVRTYCHIHDIEFEVIFFVAIETGLWSFIEGMKPVEETQELLEEEN